MSDHLNALELRLSHERAHLARAKKADEITLRKVWIKQLEKEITGELEFLGKQAPIEIEMTDDEILTALTE